MQYKFNKMKIVLIYLIIFLLLISASFSQYYPNPSGQDYDWQNEERGNFGNVGTDILGIIKISLEMR